MNIDFYTGKPIEQKVSKDGRCGACHGYSRCPSGQCCTSYGYCAEKDTNDPVDRCHMRLFTKNTGDYLEKYDGLEKENIGNSELDNKETFVTTIKEAPFYNKYIYCILIAIVLFCMYK